MSEATLHATDADFDATVLQSERSKEVRVHLSSRPVPTLEYPHHRS